MDKIHQSFIEEQKEGLSRMSRRDPHLAKFVEDWSECEVQSTLKFGNYLTVKFDEDWASAHHWGFNQGAEAALALRENREANAPVVSMWVLVPAMILGAFGMAVALPFILDRESGFVWRWIAGMIAAPFVAMHAVAVIATVFNYLDRRQKGSYAASIEYDPAKRAKYLEDEETKAVRQFLEHRRRVGED